MSKSRVLTVCLYLLHAIIAKKPDLPQKAARRGTLMAIIGLAAIVTSNLWLYFLFLPVMVGFFKLYLIPDDSATRVIPVTKKPKKGKISPFAALRSLFSLWNQPIEIHLNLYWDTRNGNQKAMDEINEVFENHGTAIGVRFACKRIRNDQMILILPQKNRQPSALLYREEDKLNLILQIPNKLEPTLLPTFLAKLQSMEVRQSKQLFNIPYIPGLQYRIYPSEDKTKKVGVAIAIKTYRWYQKTTEIILEFLQSAGLDTATKLPMIIEVKLAK